MIRIAATLCLFLASTPAAAQLEGIVDGFGIFFDEEATTYCLDVEPDPEPVIVTAYLALINAGATEPDVLMWEARLAVETNAQYGAHWVPVVDLGLQPSCLFADCLVSTDMPIERPVMILATNQLWFIGGAEPPFARFSVDRVTGSLQFPSGPGYATGPGQFYEGTPVNAPFGEPSAWINHPDGPCAAIPDLDLTWGSVKALYD